MGRPASDKRERLLSAAADAFRRHGIARTSLVDVARDAGVASGNIFYYFRSKDELASAVVDQWCDRLSAIFAEIDTLPDPIARIHAFLDRAAANRAFYVESGCPLAGLSRDLLSQEGVSQARANRAHALQISWLETQFAATGLAPDVARRRALFLLSGLQGSFVLGHASRDDGVIADVVADLKRWLDAR